MFILSISGLEFDELDRTSLEDEVYDTIIDGEEDDGEELDNPVEQACPTPESNVVVVQPDEVVNTEFCIASITTILDLLHQLHGTDCKRLACGKKLEYRQTHLGTCLVVNWGCSSGHFGGRCASQPTCMRIRVANLLLASAIVLSGNSYTKIGFLFKIMKLKFISKNLFNQYQSLLIAPTVDSYWLSMKENLWKDRQGKEIILSSDGRNDSPGHCAQYCTYSFADMESRHILSLNIVDVRQVKGRKSNNMERVGFEGGLNELLESAMQLKEVVTDGHLEISALMSKYIFVYNIEQIITFFTSRVQINCVQFTICTLA